MSLLLVLFLCLSQGSRSAEAGPSQQEEASQRFQKGVELYSAGNVRAALIEFKRAYKLMPTYQLLYNMGQASTELQDYAEAYAYYQQYLRDGKAKISNDRRTEVRGHITQLEGYLATLHLRVSEADAEITIDGVVVGVSPMDKEVVVSAGRRKVVVTLQGYSPWERYLDLAGKDTEEVKVTLISLRAAQPDNPIVEKLPPKRRDTSLGSGFWTAATMTGVVAVGTGYFAFRTSQTKDEFERELITGDNSRANIDRVRSDLKQQALITDVGLGLTAVGAVVTIILGRSSNDQQSDYQSLQMQVGPSQVAVSGSF